MSDPISGRFEQTPFWQPIAASVTGRQHRELQEPGQDRFFVSQWRAKRTGRPLLVVATADGAGSARKSWAGAWAACRALQGQVESLISGGRYGENAFWSEFWTGAVIERMLRSAERHVRVWSRAVNARSEDLATTLNLVVAGEDFARFARVGDGIMGYSDDHSAGHWNLAIEPDFGEFAGETTFLTSPEWESRLKILALEHSPQRLFVATDGIGPILFDSRGRAIHSPFVNPLFEALERSTGTGQDPSDRLVRFLASDRVSGICSDDLTLVLVRRIGQAADVKLTKPEADANLV